MATMQIQNYRRPWLTIARTSNMEVQGAHWDREGGRGGRRGLATLGSTAGVEVHAKVALWKGRRATSYWICSSDVWRWCEREQLGNAYRPELEMKSNVGRRQKMNFEIRKLL